MTYVRTRVALAVVLASVVAVFTGCASVPSTKPIERIARDADKCLKLGPCFVIQATNATPYAMVVSVNGVKVGEVSAWGQLPLFARESVLIAGRCATVSLHLIGQGGTGQSSEQCLSGDSYFALELDNRYNIWLTQWGA